MKNDEIEILQNQFKDIIFYESTHSYFLNKEKFKYSVTQFSSKFINKFDSEYWSKRKAKELGKSQEEILKEWNEKARISNLVGTLFHKYIHIYNSQNKKDEKIIHHLKSLNILDMYHKFENDTANKLIPVFSEFVIGDKQIDIAGTIDQLFWSNHKGGFVIFDWKTNSKISFENKYQKLKHPFENYDDCTLNHFRLQLMLYKYIIEKLTNIEIKGLYICWFNRFFKDYKILNIWDEIFYQKLKNIFEEKQINF